MESQSPIGRKHVSCRPMIKIKIHEIEITAK